MRLLICFFLVCTLSDAELDLYDRNLAIMIINENNIDIDSKSLKGWIRLFNSKEKTISYGYDLSDYQKYILKEYIREKYIKENYKYNRSIR